MVQVAGLIAYHAARFLIIMPAVYIIMPLGYHAGGSALSCRWVLLFSIMPAVYIIIQRCYSQSFRGVLLYHAAGLIAYQVAGLLSIR